jgi:hypothetical protein
MQEGGLFTICQGGGMRTTVILLILLLSIKSGFAAKRKAFQIEIVKAEQTLRTSTYTVPGTPSRSDTKCGGTAETTGTTSTVNADCQTTTTPGQAPASGAMYHYAEDIRVVMPDGSHLTVWCQQGLRACLHLKAGKYWAERDGDKIWIYCSYSDQELFDETGMSPGQRKANNETVKIKYHVVGTW